MSLCAAALLRRALGLEGAEPPLAEQEQAVRLPVPLPPDLAAGPAAVLHMRRAAATEGLIVKRPHAGIWGRRCMVGLLGPTQGPLRGPYMALLRPFKGPL